MHTQNRKESAMDITGVGNLSCLYNYGISEFRTAIPDMSQEKKTASEA